MQTVATIPQDRRLIDLRFDDVRFMVYRFLAHCFSYAWPQIIYGDGRRVDLLIWLVSGPNLQHAQDGPRLAQLVVSPSLLFPADTVCIYIYFVDNSMFWQLFFSHFVRTWWRRCLLSSSLLEEADPTPTARYSHSGFKDGYACILQW